jgi:hypothetical protein
MQNNPIRVGFQQCLDDVDNPSESQRLVSVTVTSSSTGLSEEVDVNGAKGIVSLGPAVRQCEAADAQWNASRMPMPSESTFPIRRRERLVRLRHLP